MHTRACGETGLRGLSVRPERVCGVCPRGTGRHVAEATREVDWKDQGRVIIDSVWIENLFREATCRRPQDFKDIRQGPFKFLTRLFASHQLPPVETDPEGVAL